MVDGSRVLCVNHDVVILIRQIVKHVVVEIKVYIGLVALPHHRNELRSPDDVHCSVDAGRRYDPIFARELIDDLLSDVKELRDDERSGEIRIRYIDSVLLNGCTCEYDRTCL